jgi:hypothetical protein
MQMWAGEACTRDVDKRGLRTGVAGTEEELGLGRDAGRDADRSVGPGWLFRKVPASRGCGMGIFIKVLR